MAVKVPVRPPCHKTQFSASLVTTDCQEDGILLARFDCWFFGCLRCSIHSGRGMSGDSVSFTNKLKGIFVVALPHQSSFLLE